MFFYKTDAELFINCKIYDKNLTKTTHFGTLLECIPMYKKLYINN